MPGWHLWQFPNILPRSPVLFFCAYGGSAFHMIYVSTPSSPNLLLRSNYRRSNNYSNFSVMLSKGHACGAGRASGHCRHLRLPPRPLKRDPICRGIGAHHNLTVVGGTEKIDRFDSFRCLSGFRSEGSPLMADPAQYLELLAAYQCSLQFEYGLRLLCHDLSVFEDEISLERIYSPIPLLTFAQRIDRIVEDFESATRIPVKILSQLDENKFSEFLEEGSQEIRDHHQLILRALDPNGKDDLTPRSKWEDNGRPSEQYEQMLHSARSCALEAETELRQRLKSLSGGFFATEDELNSLEKELGFEPIDYKSRRSRVKLQWGGSKDG